MVWHTRPACKQGGMATQEGPVKDAERSDGTRRPPRVKHAPTTVPRSRVGDAVRHATVPHLQWQQRGVSTAVAQQGARPRAAAHRAHCVVWTLSHWWVDPAPATYRHDARGRLQLLRRQRWPPIRQQLLAEPAGRRPTSPGQPRGHAAVAHKFPGRRRNGKCADQAVECAARHPGMGLARWPTWLLMAAHLHRFSSSLPAEVRHHRARQAL